MRRLLIAGLLVFGWPQIGSEAPKWLHARGMPPIAAADSFPVPLIDGEGLYGRRQNTAPAAHVAAGIASGAVVPASGAVVVAIGMSNAQIEFEAFRRVSRTDAVLVNAACWGCTTERWNESGDRGWNLARRKVANAGLQPSDVDVVWVKMARQRHIAARTEDFEAILGTIRTEWPNVRQVFVSDRIYAGWIERVPRAYSSGEPQGGWAAGPAVRQFVLNHLGEQDPFVDWGPYLWDDAAGWPRSLFEDDGTHVNAQGAAKVGARLAQFFSSSPATEWYR
ncbi:MAG TPA: hypothetical protein VIE68_05330 [Gemmatimonadota bacterium]